MNAKEIMQQIHIYLKLNDTLKDAINIFRRAKLNGIPIVNEHNQLIGIFTRSNLYDSLLMGKNLEHKIKDCIYQQNVIYFRMDKHFDSLHQMLKWLRTSSVSETPVIDNNDRPIGVITYINAVTVLINRIEILHAQLNSVMENISIGIISTDPDGYITFCNTVAKRIIDFQGAEVVGQNIFKLVPLNILDGWQSILNGEKILPRQAEFGKHSVIVSAVPVFNQNKIESVIFIIHDMTEVEKMSKELNSTKQLQTTLQTILDLAYDGIVVLDQNGVITLANKAFSDLIGKSSGELLYKPISSVVEDQSITRLTRDLNKVEACYVAGRPAIVSVVPMKYGDKVQGSIIKITVSQLDQLREVIFQLDDLKSQLDYYKNQLHHLNGTRYNFDSIITRDEDLLKLKAECRQVAKGISNILILGESGTGKELFAQAIHNASPRARKPFIKVNCAAIPFELAESELFGYEPGAFTGAGRQGKPGKFELANGGTIFLDEIGDMPLNLQSKLLRIIQDREVERVGATRTRSVDVRIIAATNKNLIDLVQQGSFRKDLYYRLNVVTFTIPPLRSRRSDISLLVDYFIQKFNSIMGRNIYGLTIPALELLNEYTWPGNVRELENVIERVMNLVSKERQWLDKDDFSMLLLTESNMESPVITTGNVKKDNCSKDYRTALVETEKQVIIEALASASGNKALAARNLGISRSTLYEKLRKYGLE
ncbi:sigma 54-interacting transcriptional regulator [Desulfallas sp. Bu1-1]|uniref:sigma-54-dependent Fis family transcriptional regulator n=1 Tax=Desulfallas sp. Bu1-1 TaxID=2787620 RepID=UPI00189D60A5|nr:sigma-54-dependent Fis family transcriptional regulator [Desulfallas sp. Bu1-1]MBF7082498.1 sigma 54-interacting transcriptional regulator [Desulfallas sp. Bu1-1]